MTNSGFNQPIGGWNTSKVTDMNGMFHNASGFNQNISSWNTSKVTNFTNYGTGANNHSDSLFRSSNQYYFTIRQVALTSSNIQTAVNEWISNSTTATGKYGGHISDWDVSQVTNMIALFKDKTSFNLNISNWNTSKVTNMEQLFYGATNFNQNISSWNVSKVTIMTNMFRNSPFNQPLNNWNVSSVTGTASMFRNSPFNQPLNNWNTSKVTKIHYMFWDATQFNQNITGWDVSKVNSYDDYGKNANSHSNSFFRSSSQLYFNVKRTPLTDSNIKDAVNAAENSNWTINQYGGHISNWDVSKVTNMKSLFQSKIQFNEYLGDWNVSNVTRMDWMFFQVKYLDPNGGNGFNNWNVSKVTRMDVMFYMTGYPFQYWTNAERNAKPGGETMFNSDLNNWDVSKVKKMNAMFNYSNGFKGDITTWNVSNVTDMSYMLTQNAGYFNHDISHWDVSKVLSNKFENYGQNQLLMPTKFRNSDPTYFTVKQ
tara:strand:- start:319 stop:1764 length:1446 start_codon:yes stop_codon:yes gene_type:complete